MPILPLPKKPGLPKPMKLPYDSAYMNNMSADRAQREQQLAGLNRGGALDSADTAEALRRMAMQRQQSQQNFNSNAARQGSLLSGRAMQGYGRMDTGYQQRGNDMQDAFARRGQQRSLDAAQIQNGASIYQSSQEDELRARAGQSAYVNRLALLMAGKKV